jgi:hypothetical protein
LWRPGQVRLFFFYRLTDSLIIPVSLGQPWPAPSTPDFNVGTFPDLSGSVEIQQAPLGLPPALQQQRPLWSEDNVIEGHTWPAPSVPDFGVGAFLAPSRSVEIQQAPLGLSPALQRDAYLEENAIGGQPWLAPYVTDLGDGNSYLYALLEENSIGGQPWLASFVPHFDVGAVPDLSGSVVIQQAPLGLPPDLQQPPPLSRFPCAQPGCTKSFKRDYERTRHQNSVHTARQGLHLCPVPGCHKSYGAGFSRADKVAEHLWKKHANLGYTKRVL